MAEFRIPLEPFPLCPYCGNKPVLCDSSEVYNGLSVGPIFLCRPCDAWVRYHPGNPIGRLANAELRAAKRAAHVAIDGLRQDRAISRIEAYSLLARHLGIHRDACNIALFDVNECYAVVKACRELGVTDFGRKLLGAVAGGGNG